MKVIDYEEFDISELTLDSRVKKIVFIRVDPEDKTIALRKIYYELSDLSWINKFDKKAIRECYRARAERTISNIKDRLTAGETDKITSEAGEYLVSELSRETIIEQLEYTDIPLAELRKEIIKGNPGFDFHSESINNLIIFGESKYLSRDNAYGSALKQIVDFIREEKDLCEIEDLQGFVSDEAIDNFGEEKRGYAAGFSSHSISTDQLIKNIKRNDEFKQLLEYDELLLIAVDVNE